MPTPALQTEHETVEKMAKKDCDQLEADRAGEHNAADARFTGKKKRVDDLVAASLAVMQAAKTVIDAEMKEADRLVDLEETARGLRRGADEAIQRWQGRTGPARPGGAGRQGQGGELQDAGGRAGSDQGAQGDPRRDGPRRKAQEDQDVLESRLRVCEVCKCA